MERHIVKRFQNLSLSSSPAMNQSLPREEQFQRIPSLPSCPTMNQSLPREKQFHNIKISFSSSDLRGVHEVSGAFVRNARDRGLLAWGPGELLTEIVDIKTKLTRSLQGYYYLRKIEVPKHTRVVDFIGSTELVEQIFSYYRCFGIDMELEIVPDTVSRGELVRAQGEVSPQG